MIALFRELPCNTGVISSKTRSQLPTVMLYPFPKLAKSGISLVGQVRSH